MQWKELQNGYGCLWSEYNLQVLVSNKNTKSDSCFKILMQIEKEFLAIYII